MGDLRPDMTEAILFEKFSQARPVISIIVHWDRGNGRSLGYAFVILEELADTQRVLDTRIMWTQRDPSKLLSGVSNIFINNLDRLIDKKAFYNTFSHFGNVLSCRGLICTSRTLKMIWMMSN